jgi:hypothetical protein
MKRHTKYSTQYSLSKRSAERKKNPLEGTVECSMRGATDMTTTSTVRAEKITSPVGPSVWGQARSSRCCRVFGGRSSAAAGRPALVRGGGHPLRRASKPRPRFRRICDDSTTSNGCRADGWRCSARASCGGGARSARVIGSVRFGARPIRRRRSDASQEGTAACPVDSLHGLASGPVQSPCDSFCCDWRSQNVLARSGGHE